MHFINYLFKIVKQKYIINCFTFLMQFDPNLELDSEDVDGEKALDDGPKMEDQRLVT